MNMEQPRESIPFSANPQDIYLNRNRAEEQLLKEGGVEEIFYRLDQRYAPSYLRIKMDDFDSQYGKDVIERDHQEVALKRREVVGTDATLLGKFAEGFLGHADRLKLFGKYAETSTSFGSEYDDYFNGADGIVEINNEVTNQETQGIPLPSVTRFSVDVTTGGSISLNEKMQILTRKFAKGRLSRVKYFESVYDRNANGGLRDIPNAILTVDPMAIQHFLQKAKLGVSEETGQITDKAKYDRAVEGLSLEYRRSLLLNFSKEIDVYIYGLKTDRLLSNEQANPLMEKLLEIKSTLEEPHANEIAEIRIALNAVSFEELALVCEKVESSLTTLKQKDFYQNLKPLIHAPLSIERAYKQKTPHV